LYKYASIVKTMQDGLIEKMLHAGNYYYCYNNISNIYYFVYICKVKNKQIGISIYIVSYLNKNSTSMKTQKIDSFVKTVSILFSGYMLILMALIIILNK
jgi:hypothetical protein